MELYRITSSNQDNPPKQQKTIKKCLDKTSKTTSDTMVEFENNMITDQNEVGSAFNRHFTNGGKIGG